MIVRQHWGQHENCYPCKLTSLSLNDGTPKKHMHNGDHWDGDPVKERIEELQREGRRVQALELHNPSSTGPQEP